MVHPLPFIWPPSILSTKLEKSVYFLLGETVNVSSTCSMFLLKMSVVYQEDMKKSLEGSSQSAFTN